MGSWIEYQDNPLLVKVTFYEKVDWGLVSESESTLTVPAGGSATFQADFTIPADQHTACTRALSPWMTART